MKRSSSSLSVAVSCALGSTAILAGSCSKAGDAHEGPLPAVRNALLIVVDTLRADHLGCYGYTRPTSPSIDRFAAGSVLFEDMVSQAPWTTPAIGALMTSRYPTELQILGDASALPEDIDTLAEILRARHFDTGAVISHSFCSSRWRFNQGFEFFDERNIKGHKGITSKEVTDTAIEFLERPRDRPFFLWVHYFDPHFGYQLHPEYDPDPGSAYQGDVKPGMDVKDLIKLRKEGKLQESDVREVIRCYDSEIGFTDHHIGRLLQRLDELGLDRDTLVVFAADHGEAFTEHDRLGHAKTLYGELLHVPLIVREPQRPAGRSSRLVSSIDVSPTILARLGIPVPPSMHGSDVFADAPERPVFSETSRFGLLRAVTTRDRRLILDLKTDHAELFRRVEDPVELHDVSAEEVERCEPLIAQVKKWTADAEARRLKSSEIDLTETEKEHLRQVGYGDD